MPHMTTVALAAGQRERDGLRLKPTTWPEVAALNPKGEMLILNYHNAVVGSITKMELQGNVVRLYLSWALTCDRGWKMGNLSNEWLPLKMDTECFEFNGDKNIPELEIGDDGMPCRVRFGDDGRFMNRTAGGRITIAETDHLVDPARIASLIS